ncbi:MAG TPA: branched-chain amino acid ABC transporter permease [Actinomycetes bacterium]|nr:branched-chain amino acid ABC transporter permease [Actinomycetes bacterium]
MIDWYDANFVLVQGTIINLLLALSLQVPFRFGVFSFAGVGAYGIGGYTAAILILERQVSAVVAILGAMVVGVVVCFVLGLVVARLAGLYLGMATIAFTLIIAVVAINGGLLTGGVIGLFGVLADLPTVTLLAFALVAVLALAYTERGTLGRRIEAVREDPELAASVGVNVRRYRQAAFVASGALGATAGAMNAIVRTTIGPGDIGFILVVLALTMMIIGGTASWVGALIGAVIFTWLPSVLEQIGEWQHLVYGTLVALAAIFMPGGLLGVMKDGWRRWQRRRRPVIRAEESVPAAAMAQAEAEDSEAQAEAALASLGTVDERSPR